MLINLIDVYSILHNYDFGDKGDNMLTTCIHLKTKKLI